MRIASLGSGSRGNGTLIEDAETCLLIDVGFSVKETLRRLDRLGRTAADIDMILVTHEHADHISGVAAFADRFGIPVRATAGTCQSRLHDCAQAGQFNSHRSFDVGSLTIEPVLVPHDAREPCQFVVTDGLYRVGLLTDIGHITPFVEERYQHCDTLMLECNHDPDMLSAGPYPFSLKQRVAGSHGHLSNGQAAELLSGVDVERLRYLVLGHVSEKNNLPALAASAVTDALGQWQGQLSIADQADGLDWLELR